MQWPIFGRDAVLRQMGLSLRRGRSQAIFGDEGVGKSRLAAELSRSAAAGGDVVQHVVGSSSSAGVPFGALAHLVSMPAASRDELTLMTSLMGGLRARAASGRRLIVVADDVHLFDEHSAAFLHQVAAHDVATLLMTARLGEPLPSAITQVWKDGLAERVEIGPLDRPAATALVADMVQGQVDDLTMTELWSRTRGNPLYLRELVLAGLETGVLVGDGAVWRVQGALPPSERLAELVKDRLGGLTPPQRHALELLAVADWLELDLLTALAGVAAVEQLEERRVIAVEGDTADSRVRAAHPIYTEVVAQEMPLARQGSIKRELADALEERGPLDTDKLMRLALWRLDAGANAAPDLLLAAANRALGVFDAPLAERLSRSLVDGDATQVDAALLLGRALAAQQRVDEAEDVLRRAAAGARGDDEVAGVALALANLLYFRAGRPDAATRALLDGLGLVSDRDWRNEIESLLVLFRAEAGQLRAVAAAGRRMVRMSGARPRAVVHTVLFSSVANVMLGRFAEADREIGVGLELAPAVNDELPFAGQVIRINGVMSESYAGRVRQALAHAREGYQGAVDSGASELVAMWGLELAEAQLLAGEVGTALETMLRSFGIVRERDPFAVAGICAGFCSTLATWLGRHDLAAKLEREMVERNLVRDVRSRIWSDRARVWRMWAQHDARAAGVAAIEAGRRAASDTHLVWAAWIYNDAARLGAAEHAAERLEGLATRIEGDLVAAMARHARALTNGDAVELERVASQFEQIGALLLAAEAAANAHRAYLSQGRQRLARVAASRAALLAGHCPGARTPPLIQMAPVPLTDRELEIARLAADGLSSRQLAERLGISARTVDNHLGTIYAKLGVGGRGELPTVLGTAAAEAIE